MASLKNNKLTSTGGVVGRYASKPKVYLEGESDVNIYAYRWFKDKCDQLDFRIPEGATGCTAVRASVVAEQANGIQAFGILDRDVLQAERLWDLLWETDDEVFLNSRPFGEHIRVTLLWELENYLLAPPVIEEYLADHEGGREPGSKVEETTAKLLEHAKVLTHHAALNSTLHEHNLPEWSDGRSERDSEELFKAKVVSELGKRNESFRQAYRTHFDKTLKFDPQSTSVEANLKGLLRRVHGKAMLMRIKTAADIRDRDALVYQLASKVKDRGVPPELAGYIEAFCETVSSHC